MEYLTRLRIFSLGILCVPALALGQDSASGEFVPSQQVADSEDRFLRGGWKTWWGEEAIITHALPNDFEARFRVASDDAADEPVRFLRLFDHVGGNDLRFARGAQVVVDAESIVLRIVGQGSNATGRWSVQEEVGRPIPHEEFQSLFVPGSGASQIVDLDEPRYMVISYRTLDLPAPCDANPLIINIDGSKPVDERGVAQPTYPGNSILTFGREVDVDVQYSCNAAPLQARYLVNVAIADPADVEAVLND